MTNINFYKRFIVYFITFGLIVASLSGLVHYLFHYSLEKKIISEKANEIYDIKINGILQPILNNIEHNLQTLSKREILNNYLLNPTQENKEKLQIMFLSAADANNYLSQVRFLSSTGDEIVRINQNKETSQAYIVKDNKLQNKKDRYYFKKASKLNDNQIWYSRFDLNIENGKIEIPYNPTLRVATPIFLHNSFHGIIIFNIYADKLFKIISHSTVFQHFILDAQNNYISHPNNKYSFNKYKKLVRDIKEDFPLGLKSDDIFQFDLDPIFKNNNHIKLVLKPKETYHEEHTLNDIRIGVSSLLITLVVSFIIALILARYPTKIQTRLHIVNKTLSQYNQKLNENKVFIESILNNSPHMIIATDPNGVITLLNKTGQQLLGYSEEELVGKEKPAIFHKHDQVVQKAKEYEQKLNLKLDPIYKVFTIKSELGIDSHEEWIYISKDGKEYEVSLHMNALRDSEGAIQGYMGIAEDITHKNNLAKQLKEQKNELQTIFNTTKDGIAIIDIQGNFLNCNKAYLEMLGYTKEELLSKESHEITITNDLEKLKDIVQTTIEKGHVENFEKTCLTNDNKKIKVNMSLALMPDKKRILIATKDITELKAKETQLKEYIKLVDKNIITSSTDIKGYINYASEAFSKISGYSKEELLGQNHNIVRHPDMPHEIYKIMWQVLSNDKTWKGELKNLKKDGSHYWVKVSISPIFDEDGNKIGYTSIRQDITDKKTIEEISITDGLTGVYNRRHFDTLFPKVIKRTKRKHILVSLIMMDIDHFKQYNDTYGHQMGDKVLTKVAQEIQNSLKRADDYCFRLGGEEFGILFKADTKEKAFEFADNIRKNIENLHIEHKNNSTSEYVTVSMGLICKNANDIQSEAELYNEVDKLLYNAKENGRNRVEM